MNEDLLVKVQEGVIGKGQVLDGPYGRRRLIYADHTASGQALDLIEETIRRQVLPRYANTHTEASATGRYTSGLREQARAAVHRAVGGGPDDVVLFCGSGATAAVNKLVGVLGLRTPRPDGRRPVVFVGPFEHHSNELPWRESSADVVPIGADDRGRLDLDDLKRQLVRHADRPLRIGTFSAASNVTGLVTDVNAVAELLHAHGALSFWDYAAAGPHRPIGLAGKDAVFLSPHKFPGGPQTPGVLVVRRELLRNAVPTEPGGGTVAFVDATTHDYLADPVAREEGGTPAIVESIRAGLVFSLREAVGAGLIAEREQEYWRRARDRWRDIPELMLLGDLDADRLPIASFLIRDGDRVLHHNFVVALLNDLFGIQSRGGCSCAGPYGHRLLGVDAARSARFRAAIGAGWAGVKPGWTRLSFSYLESSAVVDHIIEAVALIARYGRRLRPDYDFDPRTGLWRHKSFVPAVVSLSDLMAATPVDEGLVGDEALEYASRLLRGRPDPPYEAAGDLPPEVEDLRWFTR